MTNFAPQGLVVMEPATTTHGSGVGEPRSRPFQILALDGGGFRGLFSAAVLAKWERELGHSVADHFDLIVGTGEGKPDGLVHWPTGPFAFTPEELETDDRQKYDPKRSKDLIKAATGNDTVKVKIMYPISDIQFIDKHLPIFLKQMRDAGFDVQEDPRDFTGWLGDYTKVNYDASLSLNQIYETPEIALDWQHSKGPAGTGQFGIGVGILNSQIDDIIINSKKAASLDDLVKRLKDAQDAVYKFGAGFLPIMSWYSYTTYWSFVRNIRVLGDTGTFLSETWLAL